MPNKLLTLSSRPQIRWRSFAIGSVLLLIVDSFQKGRESKLHGPLITVQGCTKGTPRVKLLQIMLMLRRNIVFTTTVFTVTQTSVKSLYFELAPAILEASAEFTGSPQLPHTSSEHVSSFSLLAMPRSWARPTSVVLRCSFNPTSATGQPFLLIDVDRLALPGLFTP